MHNYDDGIYILGAGVTGLACGYAAGFPIFERNRHPGGLCASYYLAHGARERSDVRSSDEEDYRFEYGGGHWIFGTDQSALDVIASFDTLKLYTRRSSVFLQLLDRLVPYPIQNNLRYLPDDLKSKIIAEITAQTSGSAHGPTMEKWCDHVFGRTLSDLFFHPFHKLYTAGLWNAIVPQDGFKSPIDIRRIVEGAQHDAGPAGYNATFVYPEHGLGFVMKKLEERCRIDYSKNVTHIDLSGKTLFFEDGTHRAYAALISTLPLNVMQNIAAVGTQSKQDPYTSVLVVNIGAKKGARAPADHWIYFSGSESGFHRVGSYSNVENSFLPRSKRNGEYISLYIEKAFQGGRSLSPGEMEHEAAAIIAELQAIGYISEVDVYDTTWIDVAYTWSYPGSTWRNEMLDVLHRHDILQTGRYARWNFQGILDSIRDGLHAATGLKTPEGM